MYSDSSFIQTAAITNSGIGVLGGQSDQAPTPPLSYVVASNGVATFLGPPEADFPGGAGIISVSIAENGSALFGGVNYGGSPVLLYRLNSDGTFSDLTSASGLPSTGGINGVSIAENGIGLVGGAGPTHAFASFVAPDGTLTVLGNGIFPVGSFSSVAINNSCAGILGGQSNVGDHPPLAYLVSPTGTLTPLGEGLFPSNGIIYSVAMADCGVGLIGGQENPSGYGAPIAYLVAPNGNLTSLISQIDISNSAWISSVSISDAIAPQSFGPYNSTANALFALTHTLENHYTGRKQFFDAKSGAEMAALNLFARSKPSAVQETPPKKASPTWTLWGGPFGELIYQDAEHALPDFSDEIAGVITAAEYNGIKNVSIGGALAYAFTYINYKDGTGHGKVNQEYALLYADFTLPYFFFNGALWGGLYQMSNDRLTLGFIPSKSSPNGWLLSPHIEISTPFLAKGNWFGIDPFAMVDWANCWQNSFREKGRSGLNISMDSQYCSLLRSEIGIRFYETLTYSWGNLKIEEKASYVNKTPFHTGGASAAFIGSI